MKTLYKPANLAEAHMLRHLLEQEGLTVAIRGEDLQGAIGGVPPIDFIELVVEDKDFAAAQAVVEKWESENPENGANYVQRSPFRGLLLFLLGLIIGMTATGSFLTSPLADGVDYTGNGVLDEKWTFSENGTIRKVEADRNFDGEIDYIAIYDDNGMIESAKADNDFNGEFETQYRFRNGNPKLVKVDTTTDGFVDYRAHYENGVLTSTEFIDPASEKPRRIEYYRLGVVLLKADVDTNKDGVLDTRYVYAPDGSEPVQEIVE